MSRSQAESMQVLASGFPRGTKQTSILLYFQRFGRVRSIRLWVESGEEYLITFMEAESAARAVQEAASSPFLEHQISCAPAPAPRPSSSVAPGRLKPHPKARMAKEELLQTPPQRPTVAPTVAPSLTPEVHRGQASSEPWIVQRTAASPAMPSQSPCPRPAATPSRGWSLPPSAAGQFQGWSPRQYSGSPSPGRLTPGRRREGWQQEAQAEADSFRASEPRQMWLTPPECLRSVAPDSARSVGGGQQQPALTPTAGPAGGEASYASARTPPSPMQPRLPSLSRQPPPPPPPRKQQPAFSSPVFCSPATPPRSSANESAGRAAKRPAEEAAGGEQKRVAAQPAWHTAMAQRAHVARVRASPDEAQTPPDGTPASVISLDTSPVAQSGATVQQSYANQPEQPGGAAPAEQGLAAPEVWGDLPCAAASSTAAPTHFGTAVPVVGEADAAAASQMGGLIAAPPTSPRSACTSKAAAMAAPEPSAAELARQAIRTDALRLLRFAEGHPVQVDVLEARLFLEDPDRYECAGQPCRRGVRLVEQLLAGCKEVRRLSLHGELALRAVV